MTVIHLGDQRYQGLTADTKPTNVPAGFVNLFFNTTDSKLSIKDSGGTTTPLH